MALWTPAEIPTAVWLDASDPATITEVSGAVSQWDDKSGNARNATQGNAANRPTVAAANQNGLDALLFDGATEYLGIASAVIDVDHSIFMMVKPTAEAAVGAMAGQYTAGTAGRHMFIANQSSAGGTASGFMNLFNNTATGGAGFGGLLNTTPFVGGAAAIFEAVCQSGSEGLRYFKDGTLVDQATITTLQQTGFGVGAQSAAGPSGVATYDGIFCEIVACQATLSDEDRWKVEGYLAWKWGTEGSLPALHPYKDAPPTTGGGAPVIDTQPADTTTLQGETAAFTVAATGTGALLYQWFENDAFMLGENADTLTVAATLLRDGNTYTVRVTDDNGSVTSAAAVLTVTPASSIAPVLQGPTDVTVVEGQAAAFNVTAYGVGPFTYQWRFAGGAVVPGATARVLTVPGLPQYSGAYYQAVVTDASGLVTASGLALLTVVPEPVRGRGTADIDYPCALPGALIAGNSYASKPRVERNDLASGPPLFMLADDGGYEVFNVAWSFSAGEVQVFRNWFRCELASGSRLFNIGLMVDGAATKGGRQTVVHSCYFDGVPQYTQRGRRWSVSATLIAIREEAVDCCSNLPALYDGFFGDLKGAINAFADIWPVAPPVPPAGVNPAPECQPYSCQALKTWFEEVYGRVWQDAYSFAATKAEHPYPFGPGAPYQRYFDPPLTGTSDWSSNNADSVAAPGGSGNPNNVFNPCGGAMQRVTQFAAAPSSVALTLTPTLIDTGVVAVVKPTNVFDGGWYKKRTTYAMYNAGGAYIGVSQVDISVRTDIVGGDHVFKVTVNGAGDANEETFSIPTAGLLTTLGDTFKPLVVQSNVGHPAQVGADTFSDVSVYFRYGPVSLSIAKSLRMYVGAGDVVATYTRLDDGLRWATTFRDARCLVLGVGQVDANAVIDYDAVLLAFNRNAAGYTPPAYCGV